jgi:hypothetical protein
MTHPDLLRLRTWGIIAGVIIVVVIAVLALAGCKAASNGDSKPQPKHTTSVGPPGTGKPTLITEDTTVTFPKNQAETDYATAHGATWICGDSGMSFKKTPEACVGHGGPAEVVRR